MESKAMELKNWKELVHKARTFWDAGTVNAVWKITYVFLHDLIDSAIEEYISNNK